MSASRDKLSIAAWTGGQSRAQRIRAQDSWTASPGIKHNTLETASRRIDDEYSAIAGVDSGVEQALAQALGALWGRNVLRRPSTEHQWQAPGFSSRKSKETALLRGLTTIIDNAVPLLSEQDEQYLVERLLEANRGHEQDLWAAVEHLTVGENATLANVELGANLITALYDKRRDDARLLIKRMLSSRSAEHIERAVRIIQSVEDPSFNIDLQQILKRASVPDWLRDTIQDTLEELRG